MLRSFRFLAVSLVAAAMLSGCATLSKNECLEADWYEIGYADGTMAKDRAVYQRHADACRKHGVQADRSTYHRGRLEGLKVYCTEDSGYALGKSGNAFKNICPSDLEPAYRSGYEKGLEQYWFNSGYHDGENGKSLKAYQARLASGRGRYLRHNRGAYDRGRHEGLKAYCTPANGYELGKEGEAYNPVCPEDFEQDFYDAYNSGKNFYKYHQMLTELEKELADIDERIKIKEKMLVNAHLTPRQRMKIRDELREMDLEHRDLDRELSRLRLQGVHGYERNK